MMNLDIKEHEAYFAAYSREYIQAESEDRYILELKVTHTHNVLQHMHALVSKESMLAPHERACLLSALYHDVGRFPQFSRWRTFKDTLSYNHGLLGVKVLKKKCWLRHESSLIQRKVLTAVGTHNRFALPAGLPQDIALITKAVRDADKLDIIRIMADHLKSFFFFFFFLAKASFPWGLFTKIGPIIGFYPKRQTMC